MSSGKRLIAAAKEAVAIGRSEKKPARVFPAADVDGFGGHNQRFRGRASARRILGGSV
jgi:hypothetical protein